MKKNVRVLIVCENKKQTEKLFEAMEKNPNGAYVDTCYYHETEKAVMIETASDDENFLAISVAAANKVAKDNGVTIKNFVFESGW